MSANQADFPAAVMARVLGVSKAGYYARRDRPPSARAEADAALLKRVRTIHASSRQTYGAPRVQAELRASDERHGRKRIARLMREAGLGGACHRGGGPPTTRRDRDAKPAPDLVDRKFKADLPDQLWVADITYVPTITGFLYLAIVLDAFSRKIVGWSMANHLRTTLIVDALDMVVGQRRPKDVIHHSDQGSQYTSLAFGSRCAASLAMRVPTSSTRASASERFCKQWPSASLALKPAASPARSISAPSSVTSVSSPLNTYTNSSDAVCQWRWLDQAPAGKRRRLTPN